jgi:serine/threonine protein kinase/WD40 repeat protein
MSELDVRVRIDRIEALAHRLALVLLSERARAAPDLLPVLAGLARPGWATWNLTIDLARKIARADARAGLEVSAKTAAILAGAAARLTAIEIDAVRPLAAIAGMPIGDRVVLRDVLGLAAGLRNRIAHDAPNDPSWWAQASAAVAVIDMVLEPLASLSIVPPEPWAQDGALLTSVAADLTPVYEGGAIGGAGAMARPIASLLGAEPGDTLRETLRRAVPEELAGVLLGGYRVGAPIATGGYATVHRGQQIATGRTVAVKVLHDGLPAEARERMIEEALLLGRVDHPNVVEVIDQGTTAWSLPAHAPPSPWIDEWKRGAKEKTFVVLEWIEGRTIDQARPSLGFEDRVRCFRDAARALDALHVAGIVHRDVKPANLMVTGEGRLVLMDLGLARSSDELRAVETRTGTVVGTVAYMAPEQLRAGEAEVAVGPLADVFALGATFFEVFAGRPIEEAPSEEALRERRLSAAPPRSVRDVDPGLPWEIDVVLRGALEPEPVDRFRSAIDLARDLERILDGEPIAYRRPSTLRVLLLAYRRRRRPWQVGILASLLFALMVGRWLDGCIEQRDVARAQEVLAERSFAESRAKKEEIQRLLDEVSLEQARQHWLDDDLGAAKRAIERASRPRGPGDAFLRALVERASSGLELALPDALTEEVAWVGFAGDRVLVAGRRGMRAFDRSGRMAWEVTTKTPLDRARVSPDASRVALDGGEAVTVYDIETGRLESGAPFWTNAGLELAPDRQRFVVRDAGHVRTLDARDGRELASFPWIGSDVGWAGDRLVLWNGTSLAIAAIDGTVARTAPWAFGFSIFSPAVYGVPDGKRAVLAEVSAMLIDLEEARRLRLVQRDHRMRTEVAPSGEAFLTVTGDRVEIWDIRTGARARSLLGHRARAFSAAFAPDGRIATGDGLGGLRIWSKGVAAERETVATGILPACLAAGVGLAVVGGAGGAAIIDLERREILRQIDGFAVVGCGIDGTNRRAIVHGYHEARLLALDGAEDQTFRGSVRSAHLVRGSVLLHGYGSLQLAPRGAVETPDFRSIAASPDGRWIAAASFEGRVELRSLDDLSSVVRSFEGAGTPILAVSRDRLAIADHRHLTLAGTASTATTRAPLRAPARAIAFSEDGARVAVGLASGEIEVFDRSAMRVARLGCSGPVAGVAFAGELLVASCESSEALEAGRVRVFDPTRGVELTSWPWDPGSSGPPSAAADASIVFVEEADLVRIEAVANRGR